MNKQPFPGVPAAFFDRLLENVDPHRPARSPQLLAAQRLAGRWLALRRMQRKITLAQLAAQVGVPATLLQCLEAGVATAAELPLQAQMGLCNALASSRGQIASLTPVVALALGDVSVLESQVIERVLAELERADPARPAEALLVLEITLPYKEVPATGGAVALLYREPLASQILQALQAAPEHTLDSLWQQIDPAQSRFAVAARIGVLLQTLHDKGLVSEARQAIDPQFDHEPVYYYCITPAGRHALRQLETELHGVGKLLPGI